MITLEEVLSPENMREACRRVMANKGAAGVDGMTVRQLPAHFERHGASICAHIREGRYIPAAVRRVDNPKPNGGTRMLGIPTAQDRVIQQA
ncbi:group II intron reverse transcriptase/maturase, partial [Mesosutterella sp. OilRF-GAM-744-9]|nr:group II intron reverse transcriptase/maturase [Mesosutterella sp. oilRF-744-WT-GAM-9]